MYKAILIPTEQTNGDNLNIINIGDIVEGMGCTYISKETEYCKLLKGEYLIICSDEQPKRGDWVRPINYGKEGFHLSPIYQVGERFKLDNRHYSTAKSIVIGKLHVECYKVIASTNSDHNLPGITPESIQQWIDAGCPEEVQLKRINYAFRIKNRNELELTNNQVTIIIEEKLPSEFLEAKEWAEKVNKELNWTDDVGNPTHEPDVEQMADDYCKSLIGECKDKWINERAAIIQTKHFKAGYKANPNQWTDKDMLQMLRDGYIQGQINDGVFDATKWLTNYKNYTK